ncbi:efflux RND transporter permease subunit [Candidatus Nitrosacidococcus sp. I8]|uniref:efflux RND transporter permease subunit n=1 Tax=Candidatus Nitrosacidococcus sp. I8 TaxID=2942908 RepID=UPI00222716D2|nr:efflux RND transporter permease subunit [Candidatus Nitrosacidococcus sp. I8]CAH9019823.1 Efflux pump membrane transporter BepE [Candidatus Nitrosacidococcus sp. I8]
MKFTDLFIRRPVFASVVNLLILLIGLRAFTLLELRQYPASTTTVITVTTTYAGASSEIINSFITTPLEQAIAEAKGIDYIIATSIEGKSTIEAHMELNYNPGAAIAEIQAKVNSQIVFFPPETENPVVDSNTGRTTALMYLALSSDVTPLHQVTDYLLRSVKPKIQALPGVSKVTLSGDKSPAMRIWLNPQRMAALGVTGSDVKKVLQSNNFISGVGKTKGGYDSVNLISSTNISKEQDYRNLVVYGKNGAIVRLEDIGDPKLDVEDYNAIDWHDDQLVIFVGIEESPGSNPLEVADEVHKLIPELQKQLPPGINLDIVSDYSIYMSEAVDEVFHTLGEAIAIVLIVIFLFLGSLRAALIPSIAVPLSLIGSGFLMLSLGFSINLLTLLAMVLAIGLVVDDAIIVVENVQRHLEMGKSHFRAALDGAQELGLPIIAMTTTLVAVYAPIGFMGGLVGTLFTEFAFTAACAVIISGIVAITLSPMLSSKVLKAADQKGKFELWVEHLLTQLAQFYQRVLHRTLNHIPLIMIFAAFVLCSLYPLYMSGQKELAPAEDQSVVEFEATGPEVANIDYDKIYAKQIFEITKTLPEYREIYVLLGMGGDINIIKGGFKMYPPTQRKRSQMEIQPDLQQRLQEGITAYEISVYHRPTLPGVGGAPIQFIVETDTDFLSLDQVAQELLERAMESGKFSFLQKSIKYEQPRISINVNRDLAGDLGITMEDIGEDLTTMLGERWVNRFDLEGRSYKVIPQVIRSYRLDEHMLENYYTRIKSGEMIPLSTLVSLEKTVVPSKRIQFQQLNALTLQGVASPGVTIGDALSYLEEQAREIFPRGFSWDYAGESRQYAQEGNALAITFFFALIVIYLVLAAQFESWRDPIIVLMSVPMSIAGALIFLALGFTTVNIYTEMGLITLIGLIAKNGILIVEFANQLQMHEGLNKRAAVEKAASIRLRPILMTTSSMIVGVIPLIMATGAGAISRYGIGLMIATGLGIGTFFTLFIVPAVYVIVAREHKPEETLEVT